MQRVGLTRKGLTTPSAAEGPSFPCGGNPASLQNRGILAESQARKSESQDSQEAWIPYLHGHAEWVHYPASPVLRREDRCR